IRPCFPHLSRYTPSTTTTDTLPYTTLFRSCVEKYGEDSINCNIIAQLDDTGACPEVNDDGTVKIIEKEDSNGYVCSAPDDYGTRSEEHTSELQSRFDLVCRLLLEKKNNRKN